MIERLASTTRRVRRAITRRLSNLPAGRTASDIELSGNAGLLRRMLKVAHDDADLLEGLTNPSGSMLSSAELAVVYWLTRVTYRGGSIAELGAYTGGTTRVFGEALRRAGAAGPVLEVYDMFEHNQTSRARLRGVEGYNESDFFDIWSRRTSEYQDLIDLHRGDLVVTARDRSDPLDLLYVDIVKHESLVNPLMGQFVGRLRPGGLLIHQDYFHWQSPWIVYATERIMPRLQVIGTVSNHTMVLQVASPIDPAELSIDYVDGFTEADKLALMRSAIDRYPGIRGDLLTVSMLNLAKHWSDFDFDDEVERLRRRAGESPRVIRYLESMLSSRAAGRAAPRW